MQLLGVTKLGLGESHRVCDSEERSSKPQGKAPFHHHTAIQPPAFQSPPAIFLLHSTLHPTPAPTTTTSLSSPRQRTFKMQSEDVVMEDELEYESDVEADLEVDELDSSGSDQENAAQPSASTASKKANTAKQGARVPGHTLLPQVRIENILQADGASPPPSCAYLALRTEYVVLNPGISGNLALSKEGQFILSVATVRAFNFTVKHPLPPRFSWRCYRKNS